MSSNQVKASNIRDRLEIHQIRPSQTDAAAMNRILPDVPMWVQRQSDMFVSNHRRFLALRRDGFQQLKTMLTTRLQNVNGLSEYLPAVSIPKVHMDLPPSRMLVQQLQNGVRTAQRVLNPNRAPALFQQSDLQEFGLGSLEKCPGPAYAVYKNRRAPRIPNGDLLLMSRITSIDGVQHDFDTPAALYAELDVPANAWYLLQNDRPVMPISMWMELALQPCGFLSAYLGTPLLLQEQDLYFRNLGGSGLLLKRMPVAGKTLTTHTRLVSTVQSAGMILQTFHFDVSCAGELLFRGESSFGYFPPETMNQQTGLDSGEQRRPWFESQAADARVFDYQDHPVDFVSQRARAHRSDNVVRWKPFEQVQIYEKGGRFGQGYIYAERETGSEDWFFRNHFHQDAVMPGSLGVEALHQAMKLFMHAVGGQPMDTFEPAEQVNMIWKYRGQILPANQRLRLEIHFKESHDGVVRATASVWNDQFRIYELDDIAITASEGSDY